ncbi:MAG: hypothetical protein KBA86_09070 [Bacteroidales bacterium]|nr:hypothetical protein [Bacteroidales bacterium]
MSENSKKFDNADDFRRASQALNDYQIRHNLIRKDYELLLELTELNQEEQNKFDTLYRASLKGFLSLIESDIYGLSQIDKYEGYSDKDNFEDKFKKTFKRVCETWNKEELIKEYLDTKYAKLKALKNKRDSLIHPKKTDDIVNANFDVFNELKEGFKAYTKMLHSIMTGVFISIDIRDLNEIYNLFGDKKTTR